jgi:hypothetical protein
MVEQISEYVSYERDGSVGIWMIEDIIAAIKEDDISKAEEHYQRVARAPIMRSVVVVLGNTGELDDEVLYHVSYIWTELDVGVKAVAFVTEDPASGSVIGQLIEEGTAVDEEASAFGDVDDAVEWAKEQQQRFSQ